MSIRLADLPAITPARVLQLKQDAKALKLAAGLKQSAALAQIAHREGFPSWEVLVARAGGAEAVLDHKSALPPTDAQARRAERQQERKQRYGSGA